MEINNENRFGKLIAFEGIDNVGKSSHVEELAKKLKMMNMPCEVAKEMTSPFGKIIRENLKKSNFSSHLKTLLFAADRVELVERMVKPCLEKNGIVLADRWTMSAIVYRTVEGFDVDYVAMVNSKTIKPDHVFLIDLPAELSIKRGESAGKFTPYSLDFLHKARGEYLRLAKLNNNIEIIDGGEDFNKINSHLFGRILEIGGFKK